MIIVVTGPESCGKTTLAEKLSQATQIPWLPEISREYISNLGRNYEYSDIEQLIELQLKAEENLCKLHENFILDTDLLTLVIWAIDKFQKVPQNAEELLTYSKNRTYLLCTPDIPWRYDPLRENPNDRDRLFEWYEKELITLSLPYRIISGDAEERMSKSLEVIQQRTDLVLRQNKYIF